MRARLFSKVNRISLPKLRLWLKAKLISQLRFLQIQRRKIKPKGGILKQTSWLRGMTSVSLVFEVFLSQYSAMKSGSLLLLSTAHCCSWSPSSSAAAEAVLDLWPPSTAVPSGKLCSATAAAPLTWIGSPGGLNTTLPCGADLLLGVPETSYLWLPGKFPLSLLYRHNTSLFKL